MDEETFPSAAWFEQMSADARARPDLYRHLGFADYRLAIRVIDDGGAKCFGLVLDGYDVNYAGEVDDLDTFGPEATISGTLSTWQEMVGNILRNGGADRGHTLNALTIAEEPLRVTSADPLGRDKFYRYAETLQTLFDSLASHVPVG